MVGLDRAVFSVDRAALNQRQQIPLNAFSGHISTAVGALADDFVDFIDEHDARLFNTLDRAGFDGFIINQSARFLAL